MPKAVEDKLRRQGRAKGFTGKKLDAYVYGTMNKLGLLHKNSDEENLMDDTMNLNENIQYSDNILEQKSFNESIDVYDIIKNSEV